MFNSDWKSLPAFLDFFKRLLVAHWQTGLLLLAGVCLPLLVFEQLAIVIWQNASGLPWDEPILLTIHATAQPHLNSIATTLTKFGVYWGVLPVSVVIGVLLLHLRRWRSLAYWLTALLGSTVINRSAKAVLHRVRPSLWDSITPERDYGFPSGHAMSSMTFVAALIILTWGSRWSGVVLTAGFLFVVSIGWTRLYLGVHFPSDILAGWMVSIAWAIGLSLLIRPHLTKPQTVSEETLTPAEEESIAQQ